jgi:hypothetical protein
LNIQKPEDWYDVDVKTIKEMGGQFLPHYNGSLVRGKDKKILIRLTHGSTESDLSPT